MLYTYFGSSNWEKHKLKFIQCQNQSFFKMFVERRKTRLAGGYLVSLLGWTAQKTNLALYAIRL